MASTISAGDTFDEFYQYDGLNRLTTMKRGTLNSTSTGTTGTVKRQQTWSLDALGNALTLTSRVNGTITSTETNAFNTQNQIEGLTYDGNGNNHSIGAGQTAGYDAWNRLVKTSIDNEDGESAHGMKYTYDALGRRVTEASFGNLDGNTADLDSAGTTFFYSNRWQVLEEDASYFRPHGATADLAAKQATYVWSPGYVDELIERDVVTPNTVIDGGGEGEGVGGGDTDSLSSTPFDAQTIADAPDGRLYAQQDANYNVTSLVKPTVTGGYATHDVKERYAYDAYGEPTFLDPSAWTDEGASGFAFTVLNQGTMFDANADLYNVRFRVLQGGSWAQEDSLYFDNMNLYGALVQSPVCHLDPTGHGSYGPGQTPGWVPGKGFAVLRVTGSYPPLYVFTGKNPIGPYRHVPPTWSVEEDVDGTGFAAPNPFEPPDNYDPKTDHAYTPPKWEHNTRVICVLVAVCACPFIGIGAGALPITAGVLAGGAAVEGAGISEGWW